MIEEDWEKPVKFVNNPNLLHYSPMYSREDTPAGEDNSTISYNFTITRKEGTDATLTFLIYRQEIASYLGIEEMDGREYCCTNPDKQQCKAGHVIVNVPSALMHQGLSLRTLASNGSSTQIITERFNVSRSGIYYFLIVSCDFEEKDELYLQGECAWKNPYGYLPGDVYMKFPLSGMFALIYVLTFIVYTALCIKYRSVLLKLQYVILFSVLLCVLEASAWYFYRLTNNNYGHYSRASLFVVVFIATMRKTLLHLLVLLVSMGIGIVKWTLGTTKVKLGLLCFFYLFFAFLLQFVIELDAVNKYSVISSTVYRVLIVIPMALLSVCFYYWILLSLIRTIQQLTLRRQVLKLQMYKYFLVVLTLTVLLAACGALFQIYRSYTRNGQKIHPYAWQDAWMEDIFGEALFCFVMLAVALIWRPRANNTRYGYAEFFTDDDDNGPGDKDLTGDDTSVQLETLTVIGGELSKRKKNPEGGKTTTTTTTTTAHMGPGQEGVEAHLATVMPHLTDFEKDIIAFDLSDESDEISVQTQLRKLD